MSWDLIVLVVSKVAELFVDPVVRQIGYVFKYNTNIQNLKDQVENLTSTKERVQRNVDDATRNGEEIFKDVNKWVSSANGVMEESEKIIKGKDDITKNLCFMGWCPDLKMRYQVSRKAKKETQVAVKLQESKPEKVSYRKPPQGIGPVKGFQVFESRELVFEKIVEALKDADVHLVGVYGMGGVGKTTLVKEVASRVEDEGIFKSVVFATASHSPDVKKIQQAIADWLDFKIDVKSVDVRAARLKDRLKREEKILIILDDIWEEIKMEEVGIPCGNDHKGCKILMTSRDQNVFLEMDVQRDFRLEVLEDEEAWNLFQKTAGHFKDSNLLPVAIEVARECAGLPVLIVTVASALKNKGLSEWSNALVKLKHFDNQGIEARVYKVLELSYSFLAVDEKSLFLLCGQLRPHSIPIMDLLKYSLGLGLFNQLTSVKASRHRLLTVVNNLKRCCLLQEGDSDDEVKMHDVVHKFAASIATKYHGVFTVAYDSELEGWPEKDTFNQCAAIALPECKKIPNFPEVFECPEVKSFLLFYSDHSLNIPDNLFRKMKELKLVDLTYLHLSRLPTSLQFLENLQTLCLDYCVLEDISGIGELKKLQVLSFVGSTILQLPKQMRNLTQLRLLDLSRCQKLKVIPAGVLSCLTRLEELYMGNSFLQWEREGHNGTKSNTNLGELKLLSNLVTLEMQVTDAKMLPQNLFSEKLERFKVFIGEDWNWSGEYEASKTLKLQLNTSLQLERVKVLLLRTENLFLNDMKGVKNILNDLDDQGFPELKHLNVCNSLDIQYIIDCTRMGPHHVAFPNLESLSVDYLISLEKICHGAVVKEESFGCLRKLDVRNCDKLKNLFSFSMVKGLVRLQEINVSSCKIMEEIVAQEGGDNSSNDEEIKLTKLCLLTLDYLPQIRSFTSQLKVPSVATTSASSKEIVSEDEPETPVPLINRKIILRSLAELKLFSIGVEKIWSNQQLPEYIQQLTTLIVDGCGNLNYVFTSSMIGSLVQLKKLEICNCQSMKEIIATNGLAEGTMGSVLFPKLEFLKLRNLPKLIKFCTGNLIQFPSLKVLQVESCLQLKTFISDFMSSSLALINHTGSGQTNSTLFDQKVSFPKLQELHIVYMHKLTMIWNNEFQADSLKVLKVEHAKQLLKIPRHFHNLEALVVKNCDLLEEVFDLQVAASQLRTLELENCSSLKHVWKWNDDPERSISLDKLSSVFVWNCTSLKCLFPFSIAKNLPGLEVVNISNCGLEEIVSKEEISEATPKFVFPRLRTLALGNLRELKSFYSGSHTLECPVLQNLDVYHCERLKIFNSEREDMQETHLKIQQPLFSFREIVPNLVDLGLNSKDSTMIRQGQFPFCKLKILHLHCFYDASVNIPFHLLQIFQNVDYLAVAHCYFKEIFPCGIAGDDAVALARIRSLRLAFLPQMRQIWNQNCQPGQVLQYLQSLEIWGCDELMRLAPSSAFFHNLITLDVWLCDGLINLVTTSTAQGMVSLTELTVRECNMVAEIVANDDGDECQSRSEISFYKLTSLKLLSLSSLTSFSPSATCIIKFPSLEELVVTRCPKMKVFSRGLISTPKLNKVCLTEEDDRWRWVKDLNTTIQYLYAEKGISKTIRPKFTNIKLRRKRVKWLWW